MGNFSDGLWNVHRGRSQSEQFPRVCSQLGAAAGSQQFILPDSKMAPSQSLSPVGGLNPLTHHQPVQSSASTTPLHHHVSLQRPTGSPAITVTMAVQPQVPTAPLAQWVWLWAKAPQLLPSSLFKFFFFILSVGFSSHFRFFWAQGPHFPSFLSSPCCYIPVSGLFLSERLFSLLRTVPPSCRSPGMSVLSTFRAGLKAGE